MNAVLYISIDILKILYDIFVMEASQYFYWQIGNFQVHMPKYLLLLGCKSYFINFSHIIVVANLQTIPNDIRISLDILYVYHAF